MNLKTRPLPRFSSTVAATLLAVLGFAAWNAEAATGDEDATFVPITPCRIIDTRVAPDRIGPLSTFGPSDTRTVVDLFFGDECGAPVDAAALSLNVTAVNATAPTFLTLWPDGPRPMASSLNPVPGAPPTPNAVTVQLSDTGTFEVYNLAGNVDVIIDVNGYYSNRSLHDLAVRLTEVEGRESPQVVTSASWSTVETLEMTPKTPRRIQHAPTEDGFLVVHTTLRVKAQGDGNDVICVLQREDEFAELTGKEPSSMWFEATGQSDEGNLAGTRAFSLEGGINSLIELACRRTGTGRGIIESGNLTATFFPASRPSIG